MKKYNESANSLNSVVFYDDTSATALIVYPRCFEYRVSTVPKNSKDIRNRGKKVSYDALDKIRNILDMSGYKQKTRNKVSTPNYDEHDDNFSFDEQPTEISDDGSDYIFEGDVL